MLNYQGNEVSELEISLFRSFLRKCWLESLQKEIAEWSPDLLEITEGRHTTIVSDGSTLFYSWCGDWVTYHLEKAGCLNPHALNRISVRGCWIAGYNLTLIRAWAGDPRALRNPVHDLIKDDPSALQSWHEWDNVQDVCSDGYVPQRGDLLVLPRKNGDHIEFFDCFEEDRPKIAWVSAGAQLGGTALYRERNLDKEEIIGVIDISRLTPSILIKASDGSFE